MPKTTVSTIDEKRFDIFDILNLDLCDPPENKSVQHVWGEFLFLRVTHFLLSEFPSAILNIPIRTAVDLYNVTLEPFRANPPRIPLTTPREVETATQEKITRETTICKSLP